MSDFEKTSTDAFQRLTESVLEWSDRGLLKPQETDVACMGFKITALIEVPTSLDTLRLLAPSSVEELEQRQDYYENKLGIRIGTFSPYSLEGAPLCEWTYQRVGKADLSMDLLLGTSEVNSIHLYDDPGSQASERNVRAGLTQKKRPFVSGARSVWGGLIVLLDHEAQDLVRKTGMLVISGNSTIIEEHFVLARGGHIRSRVKENFDGQLGNLSELDRAIMYRVSSDEYRQEGLDLLGKSRLEGMELLMVKTQDKY